MRVVPDTERQHLGAGGERMAMAGELGHDYTYDLAHEMRSVARQPEQRRGSARPLHAGAEPRELDPDTDLGHDCAHEI